MDHSLAHLSSSGPQQAHKSMKGRFQTIEWDEELENMSREKAAADANRGKSVWIPRITCRRNSETIGLILLNHRSQIKVSYERSEAVDEQVYGPILTESEKR